MVDRTLDPHDATGARPVGTPPKKRPAWLIPLLGLLALAALLLLLLSQCGGDDDSNSSDSSNSSNSSNSTGSTATTTPAATTATTPVATTASAPTATAADGAGGSGTIIAADSPLLPLTDATKIGADGDLSAYAGTDATATAISVQSVPADEEFWAGSSADDRVWIQLSGEAGESPYTVKKGDAVSFTGKVTKNTAGFAKAAGVTDAEGKKLLNAQGQHITIAKSDLKLAE